MDTEWYVDTGDEHNRHETGEIWYSSPSTRCLDGGMNTNDMSGLNKMCRAGALFCPRRGTGREREGEDEAEAEAEPQPVDLVLAVSSRDSQAIAGWPSYLPSIHPSHRRKGE